MYNIQCHAQGQSDWSVIGIVLHIIIPDSCTAFKWTSMQLSYILSLLLYVLLEP